MRIGGGALVSAVLLGFIVVVLGRQTLPATRPEMPGDLTRTIGQDVLTSYVLPFELLAVLMLAGMLGAMYFARPED
jgi:NADH:ubiquinone oxidoreductase subunit 6 (subunit J)